MINKLVGEVFVSCIRISCMVKHTGFNSSSGTVSSSRRHSDGGSISEEITSTGRLSSSGFLNKKFNIPSSSMFHELEISRYTSCVQCCPKHCRTQLSATNGNMTVCRFLAIPLFKLWHR
uniref:Uncharacterized protein n=1 Tax=Cacopsylla melanoneura TaxID=428564 RepID=A0A8D8RDG7_9HEMI